MSYVFTYPHSKSNSNHTHPKKKGLNFDINKLVSVMIFLFSPVNFLGFEFWKIYTAIPFWVLFTKLEKSHITTINLKIETKAITPKREAEKRERVNSIITNS